MAIESLNQGIARKGKSIIVKTPKSNASVRGQIHKTRNRIATDHKKSVATREKGMPELVRDEVDGGRMAIPANTSILVRLGLPVVIEPLEISL